MSDQDRLLDSLQDANVEKTKAETELLKEKTKQVKHATLLANVGFVLRWTLVGLALGGVVKLDILRTVLHG